MLVWLPMAFLAYHRLNLRGIWLLWPVFPILIWTAVLTSLDILLPSSDHIKSLTYCVIACQMVNESKGQYLKCLIGLCLGALLVMTAYWASEFGLPVEVNDWGGDRDGFQRLGSVRADAVMVWPALLIGMSGLLGAQIAFASRISPCPSPLWLTYATLFLSVASIPPLVSTMSHGAFAGFALMMVALTWAASMAGKGGAFASARFQLLLRWGAAGLAVIIALFVFDAFQLRTKVVSLQGYYKGVTEDSGMAASRTGVWHDSINTILSYPMFGIAVTGDREVITSEYASQGSYLSHNVFLDYGRATGIPGMLLLAFFFFWPAAKMWRSGDQTRYLPFMLTHFAMFIFWISLSFQFYKTFWVLWMLMAMSVSAAQDWPATISRMGRVRQVSMGRRRAAFP